MGSPHDSGTWLFRIAQLASKDLIAARRREGKKKNQMAWLHAVRFPGSGLRCGIGFATSSEGFPETPLDVTMQGLFYQTSTVVFGCSCFFNSLLRCRAPTMIQKTFGEV